MAKARDPWNCAQRLLSVFGSKQLRGATLVNIHLQPLELTGEPAREPRRRAGASYPQAHQPVTVTVGEAMRISGLGRSSIYQLIASGALQSKTVAGRRLIGYASLRALLEG